MFVNQFDTSSPAYNVAAAVRLSGSLDAEALQHAVDDIVARHETLRTRYPRGTEGPIQQILPAVEATVRLEPVDVTETDLRPGYTTSSRAASMSPPRSRSGSRCSVSPRPSTSS